MTYTKLSLTDGTVLKAEHFNHIEDGIVGNEEAIASVNTLAGNAVNVASNALTTAEAANTNATSAVTTASDAYNLAEEAKTTAQGKQNTLESGVNIKTINGESILGSGNITIEGGNTVVTGEAAKSLKILFIGNSLTQDAVSYLPLLLDEIAPEINYTIYDWYNGGNTLAQQYSKITAGTACENFGTITNNQEGGWTSERNTVTMSWICQNCDFDVVVLQEYSYYEFADATEITNFNNIVTWLRTNYAKPFKVISFIDAPMRTRVDSDYAKAKKYAKLQITNSVSEGLVNPGTAVVYALDDSTLNTLGDRGQLTGDGTHTQEGLPCMLQSYVLALWVFDWLAIPKSILNSKIKMTAELYAAWQSFGPNLGSGVVEGTEAQYRRAQEVAIKAYKFGKQFLNAAINTFNEGVTEDSGSGDSGSGDSGSGDSGSGDSGTTEEITTEISTEGGCLSTSLAVGSEPATFANQYTTDYDVYKATIDSTKTYTITISTGLYDTDGDNMPIIAICDANNLVLGIVKTQENTQTVHQEQFIIDMTDYDGASYILMTVHKDEFSIVEGALESAEVTVAHAGSIFKESTAVGEAYGVGSSAYTKGYNLYQADNTAGGKFSLTITHGLYSSSGTPPPAIVICDSEGIVLEIIRCQTNIQTVRTETYTVDMTLYSNASYFVFATQIDEYFISTIA